VDVLRPEEDVGECLGLPAPLLLVVEVGLVPVEGLVEVFDTDHRMVDGKRHTGIDGRTAEKRTDSRRAGDRATRVRATVTVGSVEFLGK